ncbi:MAG: hypothetical protein Q8P60_15215 [Pseudorhodobacter sp.]|nr:hypothetical protein [Pseudorhodobacter sp.]
MDPYRLLFDKLLAAGLPDAAARESIYAGCRAEVAAAYTDEIMREKALAALEKVIRRQEVQALYEESLNGR